MDQNKSLLVLAQVREWEGRVTELAALIRIHIEEMNGLACKIEAAKVFIDEADKTSLAYAWNKTLNSCPADISSLMRFGQMKLPRTWGWPY